MRRFQQVIVLALVATIALLPAFPDKASAESSSLPEVRNPIIYHPLSPTTLGAPPYTPAEIRKAYNFAPLYSRGVNGSGTRIAIIDAYGSSSLSSDLASFDSLTGLPPATLNFYYPDGIPNKPNKNWAFETSLDVEWAHAIAPEATIDMVVALDATLPRIYDAISFVANSVNDTALSMSFGLSESLYPATGSFTIAAHHQLFLTMASHGTSIFASSGDSGSTTCCNIQYPASDPLVVAVGGTSLILNPDASYASETTWTGSTAGSSTIFPKPSWQLGLGDSMRDEVDVSYDGDPNTGFLIVKGNFEYEVGGTSAGSPQWAALAALASQAARTRFGSLSPQLYKLTSYHDITTGSNGFFAATTGWDYPTGLGSPNANSTVSSLVAIFIGGDVAVTGITSSRSFAYSGVASNPVQVNVTASNLGTGSQTFFVSAKANTTLIGNQTVTIAPGGSTVVTFPWNAAALLRGNYIITAQATRVLGETNISNNALTGGIFTVRLGGDVNGDCTVNIFDIVLVAQVFGKTSGVAGFNPYADLNNDGVINIFDIVLVAENFGHSC